MEQQQKKGTNQTQPSHKADDIFIVERIYLGEKPATDAYKEWVIKNIVQHSDAYTTKPKIYTDLENA